MNESRSSMRDTSAPAQRKRLLERLRLGPIDTFTARRELNVAHPAGRIQELRGAGYDIRTRPTELIDENGYAHPHVAMYYLVSEAVAA